MFGRSAPEAMDDGIRGHRRPAGTPLDDLATPRDIDDWRGEGADVAALLRDRRHRFSDDDDDGSGRLHRFSDDSAVCVQDRTFPALWLVTLSTNTHLSFPTPSALEVRSNETSVKNRLEGYCDCSPPPSDLHRLNCLTRTRPVPSSTSRCRCRAMAATSSYWRSRSMCIISRTELAGKADQSPTAAWAEANSGRLQAPPGCASRRRAPPSAAARRRRRR